jgi:catechol 2,3-dioxygenase-like lactoylglutathione lyase family enzyme
MIPKIMLTHIHPKLPMRDKNITREFYTKHLGFKEFGTANFIGYLMMECDQIQIHFFEFKELNPKENYGQVYIRTNNIEAFYKTLLEKQTTIHPNGPLETKPWRQKEFSILDPDNNLLTFGQNM